MTYRVVYSQTEFEGKLLRLRTDQIELQSGSIRRSEVVEHPGSVAVVPIDSDRKIWFVEQYRHPAGETLLELPAGTLEPGEAPSKCAQRECREEIGMAPGELIALGSGYLAPGYSTEYLHLFLAKKLAPSSLDPDEDEEITITQIPLEHSWEYVLEGKIRDIKTIAGLALARDYLTEGTS
jgi:ADP-ribose pyrophosphatase